MTQYSKINFIYRLQKWMDSVPGQTFLTYGYSWGASVVILGALFKLTHLPGANIMLYFGMGTEVIVFFLSAFDRPFDKTDDGKEIPTHVNIERDSSPVIKRPAKQVRTVVEKNEVAFEKTCIHGIIDLCDKSRKLFLKNLIYSSRISSRLHPLGFSVHKQR